MLSPWGRVVAISALLVVGGIAALVIASFASTKEVRPSFTVEGTLEALTFDVADGDIVIVGGGRRDSVEVQREERYSFGHRPRIEKQPGPGVFGLRSRCPVTLLGPCRVSYRIVVPDNVGLDIRTTYGDVSLRGYRGSAQITSGAGRDQHLPLLRQLARRPCGRPARSPSRPTARRRACRCARPPGRSAP